MSFLKELLAREPVADPMESDEAFEQWIRVYKSIITENHDRGQRWTNVGKSTVMSLQMAERIAKYFKAEGFTVKRPWFTDPSSYDISW